MKEFPVGIITFQAIDWPVLADNKKVRYYSLFSVGLSPFSVLFSYILLVMHDYL